MYIVWSVSQQSQHLFPAGLGRLGRSGPGRQWAAGWLVPSLCCIRLRGISATSVGSTHRLAAKRLRRELERQLQPDIRRKLFCFWFIVPKLQIDSRSIIRIFLNLLHGFTSFQYMLAPFLKGPKRRIRLSSTSWFLLQSSIETDPWSRLQPSLAGTTSSQLSSALVSTRLKFICYDREVRNLFGARADMLSQHVTTCHNMPQHVTIIIAPAQCSHQKGATPCARSAHQSPSRRCGASEYWSDWSMCWEALFSKFSKVPGWNESTI